MAKGSYRKKRLRVLEELESVDPQWAEQLHELRTTNPQAYRKEMMKVDVMLAAKLNRPTILSMRPKRFGGDEDPVLARRVQELRKHFRSLESLMLFRPGGDEDDEDDDEGEDGEASSEGQAPKRFRGQGDPTPDLPSEDLRPAEGSASQGRSPKPDRTDVGEGKPYLGRRPGSPGPRSERDPIIRDPDEIREGPAGPDLSALLAGTVAEVKSAIGSGDYDDNLDAIEALERAGKGRKGVLGALEARR
ncbi:MAG: hypothetical protein EA397_16405 [Deltaproteobacteria bacterium]|nr:MAG: hypothetical protein EA397_16405 [Deltaproteobacteria bacterium]